VDYDLSKVLFIATANNLGAVSPPLRDRMEIIDITGYLAEEKVEIAHRHLIPKEMDNHGIKKEKLQINKPAIKEIIESYTRESGVRELDKKLAKIMRKVAGKIAVDDNFTETITPEKLRDYLGMVEFTRDRYQGNDYAGVVTGLAWTAVGGEILFIESSLSKGKAQKLTLTGNPPSSRWNTSRRTLPDWALTIAFSKTGTSMYTFRKAPFPRTVLQLASLW